MTPDDLAEFAQQNGFTGFADAQGNLDAGAALNAVNDELSGNKRYSLNDESALQAAQNAPAYVSELKGMGSPKEIKAAITKALNGEKLGVRQLKIVQAALDNSNAHTRDSSAIQEKWGERSKTMLANRGNKHLNEWRNRDEHADNATTHEAALNEIMVDAIKNYGIDADKVKAAYDKYNAKYTDMNSLVAAMTSWVSASKPNTNEHLSYEQQNRKAELSRESSNQRGAIESGAGLSLSSQAAESGRAGGGIESGPSSQLGNDSARGNTGLRQPVDDENPLKGRFDHWAAKLRGDNHMEDGLDMVGHSADAFQLESQTEESAKAESDRLAAIAKADEESKAKAEQKAQADLEVGSFALSGSNAPSDVAASYGQNDMFVGTRGSKSKQDAGNAEPNISQVEPKQEAKKPRPSDGVSVSADAKEPTNPAPDITRVPPSILKNLKVDYAVFSEDSNSYEIEKVSAKDALKSVNEDIETYESLLKCVRGG
jgi:hypothetical protein